MFIYFYPDFHYLHLDHLHSLTHLRLFIDFLPQTKFILFKSFLEILSILKNNQKKFQHLNRKIHLLNLKTVLKSTYPFFKIKLSQN